MSSGQEPIVIDDDDDDDEVVTVEPQPQIQGSAQSSTSSSSSSSSSSLSRVDQKQDLKQQYAQYQQQEQQHQQYQETQFYQEQQQRSAYLARSSSSGFSSPVAQQKIYEKAQPRDIGADLDKTTMTEQCHELGMHVAKLESGIAAANDEAIFQSLMEINQSCDKLQRVLSRKRDVKSVEKVLADDETQRSPLEIVENAVEKLFLSRAEFQKAIN